MKRYLIILILLLNVVFCYAQAVEDNDTTDEEVKTNIKASVEYQSKSTFAGRTYATNGSVINPELGLNLKSGFYLNFSTILLTDDTSSLRQYEFAAGYTKDLFSWWNADFSYTYYHSTNTLLKKKQNQSDHTFSLSNTFSYKNWFLQNSSSYSFGAQKGLDLIFVLGKDFDLEKLTGLEDLTTSPSFTYDIGNHISKLKKLNKKLGTLTNSNKFQPLDYELSLPIDYQYYKFTFNFTPIYAIPLNVLAGESTTSGNIFYFTFKVAYKLDLYYNKISLLII